MVFYCQSENYKPGYLAQSYYGFHDYFQTEDIDNDGNLEIASVGGSARSTCTSGVFILGMQDDEIIEYYPGYSVNCSYDETRVVIDDIDGDGRKEIKLSGWTVSHLDYAPSRLVTYTFSLENFERGSLRFQDSISEFRMLRKNNDEIMISHSFSPAFALADRSIKAVTVLDGSSTVRLLTISSWGKLLRKL